MGVRSPWLQGSGGKIYHGYRVLVGKISMVVGKISMVVGKISMVTGLWG